MVLVVDAQVAGISGDMIVGGLVDMGASASRVRDGVRAAAASLPGEPACDAGFERVARRGMAATLMILGGDAAGGGYGAAQMRASVEAGCAAAGLSRAAERLAAGSLERLVAAEAAVHGAPPGAAAHLHEAGGIDTVADMLGASIALDDLGLAGGRTACTPVAVGGGTVEFSHGTTPCPAPAVLEVLRGSGIAVCPGGGAMAPRAELATPTGASLLREMAPECIGAYPEMSIEAVGHGAGSRDFDGFANVLRLVRGEAPMEPAVRAGSVGVLETLVDDATGEEIGRAAEAVLAADGALDVWITPAVGKKGRPAHEITAVCEPGAEVRLARMLIAETGTLGVRVRRSGRVEAERSTRESGALVPGSGRPVRVKTNEAAGREKAESDDVAAAAASAGIPYREAARRAAEGLKRGGGGDGGRAGKRGGGRP